MAKIWEPQDIEVYKGWLQMIIDEASDNLSDWENSFLDSIWTRLLTGNNLTELQAEKLESIYASKTK